MGYEGRWLLNMMQADYKQVSTSTTLLPLLQALW